MQLFDPKLEVPFYKQTTPGYCHPACVKMVIGYAIDVLGIQQNRITVGRVAKALRTHRLSGTAPGDLELVNSLLTESVPQIQFKSQISGRFEDIKTEIDRERPLIAWINISPDRDDTIWHAVVIHGYDLDDNKIYFIDPEMNVEDYERTSEIGYFLDNKLGVDGRLIKLIISKVGQMDLRGKIRPFKKKRRPS